MVELFYSLATWGLMYKACLLTKKLYATSHADVWMYKDWLDMRKCGSQRKNHVLRMHISICVDFEIRRLTYYWHPCNLSSTCIQVNFVLSWARVGEGDGEGVTHCQFQYKSWLCLVFCNRIITEGIGWPVRNESGSSEPCHSGCFKWDYPHLSQVYDFHTMQLTKQTSKSNFQRKPVFTI